MILVTLCRLLLLQGLFYSIFGPLSFRAASTVVWSCSSPAKEIGSDSSLSLEPKFASIVFKARIDQKTQTHRFAFQASTFHSESTKSFFSFWQANNPLCVPGFYFFRKIEYLLAKKQLKLRRTWPVCELFVLQTILGQFMMRSCSLEEEKGPDKYVWFHFQDYHESTETSLDFGLLPLMGARFRN